LWKHLTEPGGSSVGELKMGATWPKTQLQKFNKAHEFVPLNCLKKSRRRKFKSNNSWLQFQPLPHLLRGKDHHPIFCKKTHVSVNRPASAVTMQLRLEVCFIKPGPKSRS
jgi:hypothetical protein